MRIKLSAKVLFDIVNNTKNPKVAMQLIDGTYKKPVIPQTATIGKEQIIASFVYFNKWTNLVTYQCPNAEPQTMDLSIWLRAAEGLEDVSVVLPKDLKIMEAMASDMLKEE